MIFVFFGQVRANNSEVFVDQLRACCGKTDFHHLQALGMHFELGLKQYLSLIQNLRITVLLISLNCS